MRRLDWEGLRGTGRDGRGLDGWLGLPDAWHSAKLAAGSVTAAA